MRYSTANGKDVILWPVQDEAVTQLLVHLDDAREAGCRRVIVLDAPTGAGKTPTVIVTAATMVDLGRYDRVLVVAPYADITWNFLGYRTITRPQRGNVVACPVDVSSFVHIAEGGQHSVEQVLVFLTDLSPHRERMLVATTSSVLLAQKDLRFNQVDWSRCLVIVDEAHHVSSRYGEEEVEDDLPFQETGTGVLVSDVLDRGASVLLATATPFRTNSNEQVYPDDAPVVRVHYADLVDEGHAPRDMDLRLIGRHDQFALDMEVATVAQLEGNPKAFTAHTKSGNLSLEDAHKVAQRWVEDGRPKALVRIGRVSGSQNLSLLGEAFAAVGARTFDATGPAAKVPFGALMKRERAVERYQASEVDVIFVCGRGTEGTDWPLCAHVYNLGLLVSLRFMRQLLGRTQRAKVLPDYPATWRDRSGLTFFAPRLKQQSDVVRDRWHKGVLLIACYIHDHRTAREFDASIEWAIRNTVRANRTDTNERQWARALALLNKVLPDDAARCEGFRDLNALEYELRARTGHDPTPADVVENLRACDWEAPRKLGLLFALVQHYGLSTPAAAGDKLCTIVTRLLDPPKEAAQPKLDDPVLVDVISEHMIDVMQEVASSYDGITRLVRKDLVEIASNITGADTRTIERDLRARIVQHPPWTQVTRAVYAWYERHRLGPRKIHGDLSNLFGFAYSASTLDTALKHGKISGAPSHVRSLNQALVFLGM